MKKFFKGLGIFLGITSIINGIIGVFFALKAKSLSDEHDIAITFDEKTLDMAEQEPHVDLGVMFAGVTIDYRGCEVLDEPYELFLYNRFSGVEIVVPEGWYVESKGRLAFAGIENYTATYEDQKANVILRFDTALSGVSVKNEVYHVEEMEE